MSIFEDQKLFMDISGQRASMDTANLYRKLVNEEFNELLDAWWKFVMKNVSVDDDYKDFPDHVAEIADACIDLIYVTTGLMHAMELDPQKLWDEVQRSNMSKFSTETCPACQGEGCADCGNRGELYKVVRREDGKILKPATFSPPNLAAIVRKMYAQ